MYVLAWLMNLLLNLYCFIYLSLTSMMLLTIPRNNQCIGTPMNISNDTLVFHDCGIGHLTSLLVHTAFCLAVSNTAMLIALFNPIEHRYALHCHFDKLPSLTSISAYSTPRDNHSNDDWWGTRCCSFIVQWCHHGCGLAELMTTIQEQFDVF